MKKILKIAFGIIAALIILTAILYQTGTFRSGMIAPGEKTLPEEKKDHKIFKLTRTETPVIYRTVGTIRSRDEIELSPRITARIINITHRSGDSVKKGETLVELDSGDLKAAEQQAVEQLNVTEAALLQAERNYRRQKLLLERNVIPRKTFEEAEEILQTARAREKAARQALLQTKANLSYATIQSPMDGVISDRMDDPGDLASPGNIILKVFDPTRLML
ncbi:MAG: efflux RND transporter periplasmic adaptor subunit, partial [Victivallaceae bacterium]